MADQRLNVRTNIREKTLLILLIRNRTKSQKKQLNQCGIRKCPGIFLSVSTKRHHTEERRHCLLYRCSTYTTYDRVVKLLV